MHVLAKIFEIILYNMLNDHFRENEIISKYQYGFRENLNKTVACMVLTHFISTGIGKNKQYHAYSLICQIIRHC